MHYKYVIDLDERGQFQAHVEDHDGKTVWEVSYPEYYQDDETGEEMENSTIFDDGYMKDTEDVDGLEKYLKQMGTMPEDAELKSEDEFDEDDDDDDEYAKGGYNPAQDIIDSIYATAGKVYRVVADIGGDKVGMTPWYTKAVIDDVAKEVTDKGYKIIKIEEKDDSYMEGGQITEHQGNKAFTVNFKTYRNFPAAWRVIFFWGGTKPFVEVTKVTNNPFGGRLGTDFDTLDKAIAHYKSPEMKVLLMQAADVAKKAGVPMDMFAYGGMMADGGSIESEYKYAVYFNRMANGKRIPVVTAVFKTSEDAKKNIGTAKGYKINEIDKLPVESEIVVNDEEKLKSVKNIVHSKERVDEFFEGKDGFYKRKFGWVMPYGYKWDNWQLVKDDQKMADGGQSKNPRLSLFLKKFSDKYKQNEDNNMHSENVVLLAERYGGKDDVRDARTILAKHNAIGKLTPELEQERSALNKKLYPRYQEELKEAKDKGYLGGGGKTKSFKDMTFREKSASIQAKLKGSKVSPKYQKLYGKTYDSKEAKQAADAITGKIVSKMKE